MASFQERWDTMTVGERAELIRREPTMRKPVWNALVHRMSESRYAELTPIQQDSITDFFRIYGKFGGGRRRLG